MSINLEQFISSLYFKDSPQRLLNLSELNFPQLLSVAYHFTIDIHKIRAKIIVEINELIEKELQQKAELKIANQDTIKLLKKEIEDLDQGKISYFDWQLGMRKEPKNALGIPRSVFTKHVQNWETENLGGN